MTIQEVIVTSYSKPIYSGNTIEVSIAMQKDINVITSLKSIKTITEAIGYINEPAIQVIENNDLYFQLKFDHKIKEVQFLLEGKEIGFFNTNNGYLTEFYINPSFIVDGDNQFVIKATDNLGTENIKTFNIAKNITTTDSIVVGSIFIINSKPYTVSSLIDNGNGYFEVILDKPLESDITFNKNVELAKLHYRPLAAGTFYKGIPTYKEMVFNKATYLENKVEEEYEIDIEGDILHTMLELERSSTSDSPTLEKIERIIIPRV
ncbi:hypothetical protein [Metabacillus litoralis]|uniref:hypothetical protein n=1 Tax=Metabacillus litoralis TaxID=152268 RepID=UPI00203EFB66|nr:hypothetical protein [Metabacillus litoralis]MCM3160979.1 hypothetical protein [Metabacillus litoralis]